MPKGLCKGLLSADCIIISGKLGKGNDIPEEKILYLTGLHAPRLGNQTKLEDEECAFEAREFVRHLIVGKVINYEVDYENNDKLYGQVTFENKNVGIEIVSNGFAKIGFIPKSNEKIRQSEYFNKLQEAEKEAKEKNLGIFSKDANTKKRILINITDDKFDKKLINEAINTKKVIKAIVEHVFNCAFINVYIPSWDCFAKINLRFLAIPSPTKDEILYKQGKAYVERISLNHDVTLKIYGTDEKKNLVCDVINEKNQNIAAQVLKEGYTKAFTNKDANYSVEDFNLIKSFQNEARGKRIRVWKDEPLENKIEFKPDNEDELGEVKFLAPNSGDSLTVLNKNNDQIRIFLSNLKAPNLAKIGSDQNDQPWAFQAKEFIRKKCVGKKITCNLDYIKIPKEKEGAEAKDNKQKKLKMKFYTVYYNENNETKCLNVELLKNGFANIATLKIDEGSASQELENMQNAEVLARNKKVGVFSKKAPENANFSDLVSANKTKKKEFINFLTGLRSLPAVVEFSFSGSKFKVRIASKQCFILLNLIGIKTFSKDKNNSDLINQYYKESLNYVNDIILQHDCICDIITADKIGNYFGNLIINKENLSTLLLKKGLAVINGQNFDRTKCTYLNEMLKAEETAKQQKLGIWQEESLANLLKYGDNLDENEDSNNVNRIEEIKDVKIRVTEEIDFDKFYVNILPNKPLKTIEDVLSQYDEGKKKIIQLEAPIKVGTICAAKYPEDGKFYRGIVRSYNKKEEEYKIEYIDYGNIDYVSLKDLIKLDSSISSFPAQAVYCEFAYLKYSKRTMKTAVKKFDDFVDFEKELNAKICYSCNKEGVNKKGIVIFKLGTNPMDSYHAELISCGLARFDEKAKLPDFLKNVKKLENAVMAKKQGVWSDNEEIDYDIEEED